MFRFPLLIAVAATVGCGITAKNFDSEYDARWCAEWQECNVEFSCDLEIAHNREGCEFNKDKADECLNGPWTCDNSNTALSVLYQPEACDDVWSCPADPAEPTSNTGTTTTTTSPSS